jgi:hypothetical protein
MPLHADQQKGHHWGASDAPTRATGSGRRRRRRRRSRRRRMDE